MGWNRILAAVLLCLCFNQSMAQTAPMTYLVTFKDKAASPFSISSPQAYLSQRSIDRRQRFNIPVDLTDLPVNPSYINALKSISGVTVIARSKWLNNATVMVNDTSIIDAIEALPFVNHVKSTFSGKNLQRDHKTQAPTERGNAYFTPDTADYGYATNQIQMLNGPFLHDLGYTGQGMYIAVMDVGFDNVDFIPAFAHLFQEGRIKQGPDFVRRDNWVFSAGQHGTLVLSCMAAKDAQYTGTAPDATYFLFVTENDTSEYPVEEDYWIAAAEWADSAGVDVFNTSLGYTQFNDTSMNHTYADLDGNTTRITRAVDMAAKKGILSVNSAGNSGNNPWYHIAAPADADSNLTVGAVDANGEYAIFSSKGPSADGRIKPNIATQGQQPAVIYPWGQVLNANGTSFSSPIMAGMAACLWQAFPHKSNMEIIRAIEQSATQYSNPDIYVGHGIPNMARAFYLLSDGYTENKLRITVLNNPFSEYCQIIFSSPVNDKVTLDAYDFTGKKITSEKFNIMGNQAAVFTLDAGDKLLPAGVYVVKITDRNGPVTIKLVKQ